MSETNTAKKTYTILGCTVIAAVPLDADTYDKYAGRIGACVETALSYTMARSYHSKVRTGIVAELKKRGNEPGDGESQEKFVARLLDAKAITTDDLQAIAATVAGGIDSLGCLSGTERAAVGEKWLEAARTAQAIWASGGDKTFASSLAKWQAADASITVSDPTDVEQVARAIRAFDAAKSSDLL
jgi:hypothetical protein